MMKNLLIPFSKKSSLLLALISSSLIANAQLDGEFRSRTTGGGWASANTFQVYAAATDSWTNSATAPTATTPVTIRDGSTQTSNGTGYVAGTLTVGEGNAAKITATLDGTGAITGFTVQSPGKLIANPGVTIVGACTTVATATVSTFKITGAYYNTRGSGYTNATVLVGTAWVASTAYTAGAQRINNGNLYTVTTAGTSDVSGGPTGTGTGITDGTVVWNYAGPAATATANIGTNPITAQTGSILSITINTEGSGYTSVPGITITGDGTGASFAPYVGVEALTITAAGAGYSSSTPPAVLVGSIMMVGNGTTTRAVTVSGDVIVKNGANFVTGGPTSNLNSTLTIGGNLSAETPITFKSYFVTNASNLNVILNKAGVQTTSGAQMTFNNLTINSGTTQTVNNEIIVLGTITNNGAIINNGVIKTPTGTVPGTYSGSGAVLGVTLTSLTAKASSSSVTISWATSSEINSDKFVVERSADGVTFNELSTVASKGPSIYNTVDYSPANGINYYRLVQFDRDGKSTIYGPVVANFTISNTVFAVYPNPATSGVAFQISGLAGTTNIVLSDILGNVVHSETINNTASGYYKLALKSQPTPGQYLLQLSNNGSRQTSKVIIQ